MNLKNNLSCQFESLHILSIADESTEDALVEALVGLDIQKVMDVLVTDILAEGDVKTAKNLQSVFVRLGRECYKFEC